jgi:hypothetical protein
MSIFGMFGGGSNAFKNQVKAINNNEALSDTEKMEAIDLLLNPVPVIPTGAVMFSDTLEYAKFEDGSYAVAI